MASLFQVPQPSLGLMGARRDTRNRMPMMPGMNASLLPPPADAIDEAMMARRAEQERLAAERRSQDEAVLAQRPRERVSFGDVLGRVLAPETFRILDERRAANQAEANRGNATERTRQILASITDPRERAIFLDDREAWSENVAYQLRPRTLAPGSVERVGGRTVAAAPVTERFEDRFGTFDPLNPQAGAQYSDPRGPTYSEATSRFEAENPVLAANATWVGPNGQPRAQGYIAPEVVSTPQGGTTNVFDPRTGQVINSVQGNPGREGPALTRFQERQLEEYLGDLASIDSIDTELGRFDQMIASGELDLGPLENFSGGIRNAVGMSSQNSRNMAEFRSTLERIRNDSLRLNKGVQTEGDAQRAWNELVSNINDPAVVRQQLARIRSLNARARQFREGRVAAMEGGSGVGGSPSPANTPPVAYDASGQRFVVRNGQWVPE